MKHHISFANVAITATWLLFPCIALAQQGQLSLQHGTFVRQPESCDAPPFAAIMSWDGGQFSGPHSSQCVTHILEHKGNRFTVATTCAALGDGSPDQSDNAETFSLRRLSATSFVLFKPGEPKGTYRWCSTQ